MIPTLLLLHTPPALLGAIKRESELTKIYARDSAEFGHLQSVTPCRFAAVPFAMGTMHSPPPAKHQ